jgi:hypothetical protein
MRVADSVLVRAWPRAQTIQPGLQLSAAGTRYRCTDTPCVRMHRLLVEIDRSDADQRGKNSVIACA